MSWLAAVRLRIRALLAILVVAFALVVVGFVGWQHLQVFVDRDGVVRSDGRLMGGDFVSLYVAGRMAAEDFDSLYDYDLQLVRQQAFARQHGAEVGRLPFPYPPLVAVLLIPLAALPFFEALVLWTAISVALFGLSFWWICRELELRPAVAALLLLGAAAFVPFSVNVLGARQTSCLGIAVFAAHYSLLKRGRDAWAGAALGLAYYKPPPFLFFVLMATLRRRWTVLKGFALTAGALLGLTIAVTGFAGLGDYLEAALLVRYGEQVVPGAGSAIDMGASLLPGLMLAADSAWTARILFLATVVGATLWARRLVRRQPPLSRSSPVFDRHAALDVSLSLWLSPYLMIYDLSMLIVPMLLLAAQWQHRRLQAPDWLAAAAIAGLFAEFLLRPQLLPVGIQPATLFLTLWVGALAWSLWRAGGEPAGPPVQSRSAITGA